jgi:hypothetical protein
MHIKPIYKTWSLASKRTTLKSSQNCLQVQQSFASIPHLRHHSFDADAGGLQQAIPTKFPHHFHEQHQILTYFVHKVQVCINLSITKVTPSHVYVEIYDPI